MTQALVPGSISAVAQDSGRPLALAMMDVDAVVIVDTSGSMGVHDSRDGQQRYDVACQELAALQARMPGKLAIVSFSDTALLCPTGVPSYLGGGTNLAGALRYAKTFDVDGVRFIVVSDGEPDSERDALTEAARISGRIDTIYVGPEMGSGREFLARLANASGGKPVVAERALELTAAVTLLLDGPR